MTAEDYTAESCSYKAYGAAQELQETTEPEVLICGAAGTGKSRACLEKLHRLAEDYKGCRLLICRKTRESLNEAALVTYEDKVRGGNLDLKRKIQRRNRQHYEYGNGSEIIIGGLCLDTRIMSTEFDVIYVQEATELTENDWEALTTRLRNGVTPYQQIIADCNPSSPQHWLKKRCDRGVTRLLTSRHEDNPQYWDEAAQEWTAAGKNYLARLDALTGVRRLRLRLGQWAMAEGMVYAEVWRPELHIIDPFPIPNDWTRYWVVDFGFTNPLVWQEWAEDGDGRLYRVREIYRAEKTVEEHAQDIHELTKDSPKPEAFICDHDAEGRAVLERYLKIDTVAAYKSVADGIQLVMARLRVAGDGKPRLFLFRDARLHPDTNLVAAKRPTCTEEEIESYVWDGQKEKPLKENDHGMDAVRYVVAHVDFNRSKGVFL
jgi:phage terminase large subunit